jgi:hypothetical protein
VKSDYGHFCAARKIRAVFPQGAVRGLVLLSDFQRFYCRTP